MPTDRTTTNAIGLEITLPDGFAFSGEQNLSQVAGGNLVSDVIEWDQGNPLIPSFGLADIGLRFFSDAARLNQIQAPSDPTDTSTAWNIGDQTLDQIVFLDNFVDNLDNTGSVRINLNPVGVTAAEINNVAHMIYAGLYVSQPDPGE